MTNRKNAYQAIMLAAGIVVVLFLWQGKIGFNIGDEGFLWYGAQRVMRGEVPLRDFMAYDPGRYYWSAAVMKAWGSDGIMPLRAAVAIFQAFGLAVGLFLIGRSEKNRSILYSVISALILVAWMYPLYKSFDIAVSIMMIGALTFLIEKPSISRYFIAGICLGVVAVFGRNHGLYGAAGSLGVIGWLRINRTEGPTLAKGFFVWVAGVVVGFSPILLMALLVPGFAASFVESIRFLFEYKSTNLPLPIPWPWRVNWASGSLVDSARAVLIGIFFIATLAFGLLSLIWVVLQKLRHQQVQPVFAAASFLALPYAHYAYSRADVDHLALGVFPLLIGSLVLIARRSTPVKWSLAIAFCVISLCTMYAVQPAWQCRPAAACVDVEISGTSLRIDPNTAVAIKFVRGLAATYAPNGGNFVVAPFWPSIYAVFDQRSPMWEIYALFPRSQAFQLAEIERIKKANPRFILVLDIPLDGRDDLRFTRTHPLIYQYIVANFERVSASPSPDVQIFKATRSAE
jgi:hypothetical protein